MGIIAIRMAPVNHALHQTHPAYVMIQISLITAMAVIVFVPVVIGVTLTKHVPLNTLMVKVVHTIFRNLALPVYVIMTIAVLLNQQLIPAIIVIMIYMVSGIIALVRTRVAVQLSPYAPATAISAIVQVLLASVVALVVHSVNMTIIVIAQGIV